MTVMIKDMEMPRSCYYCRFRKRDSIYDWCLVFPQLNDDVYIYSRHPDCPLVEVQDEQSDDTISRQAAITIPILPKWNRKYLTTNLDDAYELGWDDCQKCIEALPSAQPDYDKIIAEIKQCISETREHGKHHAKFVQDNGELYISGLEMALSIIEENR